MKKKPTRECMKAVICGPIRNCAPYIHGIVGNMLKLGTLFTEFVIIFSYDLSFDKTLSMLKYYKSKIPNMIIYENPDPMLQYRTHRIAKARNECLAIMRTQYPTFEYMIMMDCDDVNCKKMNLDVVQKSLADPTWDSLSFMTSPTYYDIWALSYPPYFYSYNHFNDSYRQYYVIQHFITKVIRANPGLTRCLSAFNGFALYRVDKFVNCEYDGRVNLKLIPPGMMYMHSSATRSPVVFKRYFNRFGFINVDGRYEDCEHRAFHVQAVYKNKAQHFISPEVVFTSLALNIAGVSPP